MYFRFVRHEVIKYTFLICRPALMEIWSPAQHTKSYFTAANFATKEGKEICLTDVLEMRITLFF